MLQVTPDQWNINVASLCTKNHHWYQNLREHKIFVAYIKRKLLPLLFNDFQSTNLYLYHQAQVQQVQLKALDMTFKTWDFRGHIKEDFEGDFEGNFKGLQEGIQGGLWMGLWGEFQGSSRGYLRGTWRRTWRETLR